MKIAAFLGVIVVLGVLDLANARPLDEDKSTRNASVYVLGNLHNAAVSHDFSKSQAAADRNESEWNSTELLSGMKNKNPNKHVDPHDALLGSVHAP